MFLHILKCLENIIHNILSNLKEYKSAVIVITEQVNKRRSLDRLH